MCRSTRITQRSRSGGTLLQAFHREHERIFAFHDADSIVEAIAWRAQASCEITKAAKLRLAEVDDTAAASTSRRVYFTEIGWSEVPIHGFAALPTGAELVGPAIVESRFTSVVIVPGAAFQRSAEGNLVVRPRIQDAQENSLLRKVV